MDDLTEADREALQEFIEVENQKAKVQTNIHNFTDVCFVQNILFISFFVLILLSNFIDLLGKMRY